MSVSLVLLIVMVVLYACGIYLLLERSMTRVLLGFLLVGNATNLLILIIAGKAGVAPIVTDGVTAEEMTDPLPQAFILTAIVITFGVSAFLMALIYRSWRLARVDSLSDDEEDISIGTRDEADLSSEQTSDDDDDTEFGTRAEAAVSTARDLEERDELAAARASEGSGDDSDERNDDRGGER